VPDERAGHLVGGGAALHVFTSRSHAAIIADAADPFRTGLSGPLLTRRVLEFLEVE
jgi:hypothetical protein